LGKQNNEHQTVTFLKSLYQYCNGGFIHILLIDRAGIPINKFVSIEKIDSIPFLLKDYRGYNVYFGVATRLNGDMTKEGIIEIPCLWVDIDLTDKNGLDIPEDKKREILQRLKDFPLKPSFLINSGGGLHAYWKLKTPFLKSDIPLAENLLKRLAFYFGGDRSSTDASHNLRLPGTLNLKPKYKTPRKVTVEEAHPEMNTPQNEYSPDDFEALLPQAEEPYHLEERQYHQETNERLNQIMECEFLKHCDEDRAILPEPEWYAMVSILARETGGPNLIHNLSRGYPQYSPGETDKKILHALNDTGPATCDRIKTIWDCKKDCGVRSPVSLTYTKPLEVESKEPKKIFILPTLSDICDLDIKVEWVVEKLIPKQAVTVLHGKGGIGKTWLMLQLGSCVAEGTSFCGLATQKMPCYYIDFENSLATLHDRAVVLGRSNLQVWHISNPLPPPRLDSNEWVRFKDLFPGLLIFDTLRAAQLLDENSSRDMTTIMMRLKVLRDLGFTPVLIHHTPKSDERIYKGSTAIQDQCDHVLSLDRVKSVGSEQEVDGDEEDWDHPLRLGVRGKTRYEPFSIYLQFDPSKGFEVAPDPDDESLKNIHSLLVEFKAKESISPNQTQIITYIKDLGINRKKLLRLLRKGEGRLWDPLPQQKSRAILYDPITIIPLSPPYIGGTMGQWYLKTGSVVSPSNKMTTSEPVENTSLSHCHDAMKNNGITDKEPISDYEVLDDGQLTY